MKPATKRFTGRWYTSSGGPSCSIRPSRITATRSPIDKASAWSWVTNSAGVPVDRRIATMSARSRIRRVGIEAGEGLVEQHEPRFGGQRPGQGDALALAAGQLVGVAVAVAGRARSR